MGRLAILRVSFLVSFAWAFASYFDFANDFSTGVACLSTLFSCRLVPSMVANSIPSLWTLGFEPFAILAFLLFPEKGFAVLAGWRSCREIDLKERDESNREKYCLQ